MSNFVTALLKQRREAKKAEPKTNGRLKEILAVLNKFNYDNGFTPEIIVGILEELGPIYVKLGQIASRQSEYMPAEYCEALAKLRSKVAPMDLETVYAQIEKYLGKPANELFATFNEKPLGSASVAQVHKATLQDGTVVAVKVRRPGIVDTVTRDFALIIVAVIIGSSLLCTTSAFAGDKVSAVTIVFRGIGLVGFVVGLFFAQRLFRNMLKEK